MFPTVLQRDTSAHRLNYPRLIHCDVAFQPGPKPIPIPRLPPHSLLTPPPNNLQSLDYTIEQQIITEITQRKQHEATLLQQQQQRQLQDEQRQRELQATLQRRNQEATAERHRKEAEERKEAEGNRKRHEVEQEKLRHIAEAYKKQRAAVEAFTNNKPSSSSSSASSSASVSASAALPVAPPVNRANRPSATHPLLSAGSGGGGGGSGRSGSADMSAVSSFQSITGVTDSANATLLLSLLENDVDYAVNLYFADSGRAPDIHAAIDKAIMVQERRQQQQQQQR